MPFGPGTYGEAGGAGLAGPALQRQGIPQPVGEMGAGPSSSEALSEAMKMLRGGQVGAEHFLAVLSMLAGQILPQMQQMQQPGMSQEAGPAAAPSIQDLLG